MVQRIPAVVLALALPAATLGAGEVAAPVVAKFLKIIVSGGEPKIDCQDGEVGAALAALNLQRDPAARVVWSNKDVARLAKSGKLVVCGAKDLLDQGAGLAIVAEDGHPVIYINKANVAASKVVVPDAVLKIAKVK
jgi:hypothetical protein